jgi:hypothetical protein
MARPDVATAFASSALPSSLEELNVALVFLRCLPGAKGSQVATFARSSVLFDRIEPILARFEFADHVWPWLAAVGAHQLAFV